MKVIITYEGFLNEWTEEKIGNCVLHHGDLNPKDDYIFGWQYWENICKSYIKMGYEKVRAIIVEEKYILSEKSIPNTNAFMIIYEPKENDLIVNF